MEATEKLIDELLAATLRHLHARPRPESTYRLQFHKGFTFNDAAAIAPYLRDLGITHVYASPYLKAAAGSTHGYDVIDHNTLNPELGTDADFIAFLQALADNDLAHILDTVPNHAGVATNDNAWWNDVLLHGPASAYARYFDIAWQDSPLPELRGKILLPLLGAPYGEVLEQARLRVTFQKDGSFLVHYFERHFPIDPSSIPRFLCGLNTPSDAEPHEFKSILEAATQLPATTDGDPQRQQQRRRDTITLDQNLAALAKKSPSIRQHIERALAALNGTPDDPRSFDRLDDLLAHQSYRLTFWRNASDEINYRRFFDINDLAALSMEHEEVFLATHEFLLNLLAESKIAGLRIDHPDGLYDPDQYFARLQFHHVLRSARAIAAAEPRFHALDWKAVEPLVKGKIPRALAAIKDSAAQPLYVAIEKILATREKLPPSWPIDGTSGYDFLIHLNGLFVDPAGEEPLTQIYTEFISNPTPFSEHVYQNKKLILENALASELQTLAHQADRLAQKHRHWRDFTLRALREGLRELIACFPVYRSYITPAGPSDTDREFLQTALSTARRRNPKISPSLFDAISDMILQKYPDTFTAEDRAAQARFAGKFQQLTAPVTAKGIEDTAFYRYHRLVSLNEVGGDPHHFGTSTDALHAYLLDRQKLWPHALSPLSTHDTKRSEDVRARLHALSEIPVEWQTHLHRWRDANAPLAAGIDPNDQYLLYQTLLGTWPLEGVPNDAFAARIQAYMIKALRESKVRTSWTDPDKGYESAIEKFAAATIRNPLFLADFLPFAQRIAHVGLLTSLSQNLLRLTAPGAPDTYQGTELWDFSLVDPDNRRPVDYAARRAMLAGLQARAATTEPAALAQELLASKNDARIKLFLTWKTLSARRTYPALFSRGTYTPLTLHGPLAHHAFAFLRQHNSHTALILAPRLLAQLTPSAATLPLGELWHNTTLRLPPTLPTVTLKNIFTTEPLTLHTNAPIPLATLLRHYPFALFLS